MKIKIIKYSKDKEIANSGKLDDHFKEYKSQFKDSEYLKWMFATSNNFKELEKNFIFVAISYVTEIDMQVPETIIEVDKPTFFENFLLKANRTQKEQRLNGKTVIYKADLDLFTQDKELIDKYKEIQIGGIVSFAHEYNSNEITKTDCFILNFNGINRLSLSNNSLKKFNYPKRLIIELDALYKNKSWMLRIKNCIFDHYFYVEQYREGIHVMQLYDLSTMQIQQSFNIFEEKKYSNKYGKSILAISKNKQMIAFSSGYGKLSLYLIENGLEIICKDFGGDTKIIASDFKDDNQLMIIINKAKHTGMKLLLWNLYTDIFQYEQELPGIDISIFNSAKISGKYVSVNKYGRILSIYDSLQKLASEEERKKYYHSPTKIKLYSDGVCIVDKSNEMKVLKQEYHIVYHQDLSKNEAQPLIDNIEPWLTDDYEKIFVYLDRKESKQLYIGKCTVQVWCKIEQKENFILKYFWVNEDNENKYTLEISELNIYENGFSLKLKNNFQIKWFYNDKEDTNLIRYACDALEYLNYQRNKLIRYENQHVFEEIKYYISIIIWRFITNYPNIWKILDIHYNLMAKIIIGGSNSLIKNILFGDEKVKHKNLHIPRITRWIDSGRTTDNNDYLTTEYIDIRELSDLQIAIKLCKPDLECNRRILVVTYLLEYYTKNATKDHGWLITISKALPDLYTYKLENCVSELFYKKCMEGIEISNIIEYTDFMPAKLQITLNENKFAAFNPNSNLKTISDPELNIKDLGSYLKLKLTELYVKIFSSNYENYSSTVKIVPLHNFTVNGISKKTYEHEDNAENISQLSPFVQIIRSESNNDIFNNPVMEAVINYKWRPARNYFLRLFLMYILFAVCFATICGNYVAHSEATGYHYLVSTVTAIVVISVCVIPSFNTKNAFADAKTSQAKTVAISFTMLLLWFEFILYLRLLSEPAKYIYIMLNIIKETWMFLSFMILIIAGLAHSFLLLLQYPDFTNLTEIKSSSEDNPAENFITSFLSTYNWLNVTILQNMFIAFMGGVYSKAYAKGRVALLRFRAESISDYETLDEIYFYPPSPEPKYIYYNGKSKSNEEWEAKVKKYSERNLYDDYEEKIIARPLSYEEDNYSSDYTNSENEKKNDETIDGELNKVDVKGKKKE
ncbi:12320_t:CDS:10, partial [Funneliformis geosporum]